MLCAVFVIFLVIRSSLVIINDLYLIRIAAFPSETNAPLIIEANAVLPRAPPGKFLQTIARRHAEIRELRRSIEHPQFTHRAPAHSRRQSVRSLALEYIFGVGVPKASDHKDDNEWRY